MSGCNYLEMIEAALDEVLPGKAEGHGGRGATALSGVEECPKDLSAAMRWAVEGGGKRIRPQICLAAAVAVGGRAEDALMPACAIELLHSYTLVHDDLPAMDNDTERRGKPSVWAKFGEANAILAGDALQALAFQVAARTPRNVAEIVGELGRRGVGVVAGQVEDLRLERGEPCGRGGLAASVDDCGRGGLAASVDDCGRGGLAASVGNVDFVYEHKTADLFMAAACMGAWAGGGDAAAVERLRKFAINLGLAFQYEDDLLDGDSPYSREETERRVHESTAAAIAALEGLSGDTEFLASLAKRLVGRNA